MAVHAQSDKPFGDAFRNVGFGHQVGRDAVGAHGLVPWPADGRYLQAVQGTGVEPLRFKAFPETFDAVGGGEDEPVVCAEIADGGVDAGVVFERLDVDGGELDDLGAEIGKLRGKPAGLVRGRGSRPRCGRAGASAQTSSGGRAG